MRIGSRYRDSAGVHVDDRLVADLREVAALMTTMPPQGRSILSATDSGLVQELTVGDVIRRAAALSPEVTALVEAIPGGGRSWTYARLLADAEAVARALLGRFAPGEKVAVWAPNIPEWILLQLGAGLAGLTLVTVNPALRNDEARHVLAQSGADGLFHVAEYRGFDVGAAVAGLRPALPALREVIRVEELAAFAAAGDPTTELPLVTPDDLVQIQYTSGTTGVPKGATLRHRGIVNNAILSYTRLLGMRPGEAMVNPMPLFHTAGSCLAVLSLLWSQGTHVLAPGFDPAWQLELIERHRAPGFCGVPTMLHAMLAQPGLAERDLSCLRYALSGGATVDPALLRRIEQTFGIRMCIIYAQTEASPGITMTRLDDSPADRAETLGRPLPAIDVKIAAADGTTPAPLGEVGELCTRGYHVMAGYHDEPGLTAAAIDDGGWLHTGDLAAMDPRGYLTIRGRLKEMIIRGGENIYPREIEEVLARHLAVAQVAVVGVPDEKWGEQVAAAVIPAAGATLTAAELEEYGKAHLAPHKVPRVWAFVDAFPVTGSGKIRKNVLRDRLVSDRHEPQPPA
jgi:fatty-acyl-CoA synthase